MDQKVRLAVLRSVVQIFCEILTWKTESVTHKSKTTNLSVLLKLLKFFWFLIILEHLNWNNQSFQVVDSDIPRFSTTKKHGQIEPGHFQYNFLSSHLAMFTRFEKLWSRLLATVWQFFSRKLWFYIVGKLIMWLSRGASQKKIKIGFKLATILNFPSALWNWNSLNKLLMSHDKSGNFLNETIASLPSHRSSELWWKMLDTLIIYQNLKFDTWSFCT